jgi:hypothetical protein
VSHSQLSTEKGSRDMPEVHRRVRRRGRFVKRPVTDQDELRQLHGKLVEGLRLYIQINREELHVAVQHHEDKAQFGPRLTNHARKD